MKGYGPQDILDLSFDRFWDLCREYQHKKKDLGFIWYSMTHCSYSKCPWSLLDGQSIKIIDNPWPTAFDLEYMFEAYLLNLEGNSYARDQQYIQGDASYDAGHSNLDVDWRKKAAEIQHYNSPHHIEILKQVIKKNSSAFCQQFAKLGVIFMTCSRTGLSYRLRDVMSHLYWHGELK